MRKDAYGFSCGLSPKSDFNHRQAARKQGVCKRQGMIGGVDGDDGHNTSSAMRFKTSLI